MNHHLEAPLDLSSGLVLPNRLAKSAMTEALGDDARLPSPDLLRLYERWAGSGAGLLITGNVGVDRDHPVRARDIILDAQSDARPFRVWSQIAKSKGARVVMQLNHGGRQTPRFVNPRPLGPSSGAAVKMMHAFGEPRAATEMEIADIVERFTTAALLAQHTGFDGVQIHAAHGYLVNQFLAPDVNRRDDAWGGSILNRARLLVDIVRAVRSATGKYFTLLVKLNCGDFLKGGLEGDDALEVVRLLDKETIDLLEISGGRYESGASFGHATPDPGSREAYFFSFAEQARTAIRAPLMLTGGLRSRAAMQSALGERALDIVGLARPMAVIPDYPRRLLAGEDVARVTSVRLGIPKLEGAAELAWYSHQLARMGRGQDPDLAASPLRALLAYVGSDALEGTRARAREWMRQSTCPLLRLGPAGKP